MTLETPLTDLLGIRHPVLQAPMACGALAAAGARA
jgi:NAD(P)H-dependent flavin oxidoreductase YrpB (nitropropane dioxygenase family)